MIARIINGIIMAMTVLKDIFCMEEILGAVLHAFSAVFPSMAIA